MTKDDTSKEISVSALKRWIVAISKVSWYICVWEGSINSMSSAVTTGGRIKK